MHHDGVLRSSLRFRLAALALAFGIATGLGHGVAWAEGASETDSGAVHSSQTDADTGAKSGAADKGTDAAASGPQAPGAQDADPKDPASQAPDPNDADPKDADPAGSAESDEADPSAAEDPSTTSDPQAQDAPAPSEQPAADVVVTESPEAPSTTGTDQGTPETPAAEANPTPTSTPARDTTPAAEATVEPAAHTSVAEPDTSAGSTVPAVHSLTVKSTAEPTANTENLAVTTAAAKSLVTVTTPSAPQPLSPIAELLELPGRIINAVLEIFGFTTSSDGNKTPFTLAPINDLIFAVFRGVELLLGFDRTPPAQQVVPTETYTGPLTGETPTVAQFLNAAAAAYVLGGVPGGLVPFTVNGFQMQSTNLFSGMSAKVWVTPQRQIIIAYQGTTGGTNLLFNPLIAISQLLADMQVIFTNTTPWAFYDALDFARRVQAEAAEQGYGDDRIFVTGHSLGGWEAEFVAQQTGLDGIGFESPGLNTVVAGNGRGSGFVNIETYGDVAAYLSTDLPGLQPFMPEYVPDGGSKPHYGSIVMIGDPTAVNPLYNSSPLWGKGLLGSLIFMIDFLGNFLEHHLPGMQAYNLDVTPDPGVVTWLGVPTGPVNDGWGEFTIAELLAAASDAKVLVRA